MNAEIYCPTLTATEQGFAYACNHIRWELQLQRRWGVRHLKNRLWELFLQVLVHKTVRFQKEKDQHKMFKISKYFLILQISFSPLWKWPLGSILNAVQLIFHILIFSSKVFVSFGPAEMICENFPLLPSPLSTPEKNPSTHQAPSQDHTGPLTPAELSGTSCFSVSHYWHGKQGKINPCFPLGRH